MDARTSGAEDTAAKPTTRTSWSGFRGHVAVARHLVGRDEGPVHIRGRRPGDAAGVTGVVDRLDPLVVPVVAHAAAEIAAGQPDALADVDEHGVRPLLGRLVVVGVQRV